MAKTIKITSGNKVISIESDDAGVPDVTQDAGPDLMKLQNDAMAAPNEENAEFNAAQPDSQVESEDKPQEVEKANEALVLGKLLAKATPKERASIAAIMARESDDEPAAQAAGEEPAQSDNPVTPDETAPAPAEETPATEPAAEETPAEGGAGTVTEGDGVTTIDTGDTIITITDTDKAAEPAPAEETPATEPAAPATEETPAEGAENAPAEPEQNTDQAIESFFRNLGL